ncbi:MAG: PepSY domain-containing protein [Sphingomonas sp.]|uniref:PepSY-associated TM helix domain-containing protein n=1 Tax=Sphingomonas sp. TaxID=28214 RepID=UPI001B1B7185|nr:PepSY-associated TM helix domain-containing protein [Sphingomonas sp.]MBO9621278.1 PepSY domain-containing protein [Sphingomonas sp.]
MTKIGLRNLWFQLHKWIGLILAVLIIPISITGAALVWHDPILEWMHPERHHATSAPVLPLTAYVDSARAALGEGERLSRIELRKGEPVVVMASKPSRGRPQRTTFYLDPATAQLIARENSSQGVFQVMHVLHGSLMIPGVGRTIVGWIGVAMLLSSISGLWLWWPTVGSWVRGLRWRRHRNLDTNLHHMMGFWIALPLFVLSLTGVWISFPQVFAGFDGGAPKGPSPMMLMMRAKPLETTATPLDQVVEHARAAAPGEVRSVMWPTDMKPEWTVQIAAKGPPATVTVSDKDGSAQLAPAPAGPQGQTIARTMRQIHDGQGLPFVWQLIVFLGGLIPAILAITGIIMWWRARGWRGQLAERKRAKALA